MPCPGRIQGRATCGVGKRHGEGRGALEAGAPEGSGEWPLQRVACSEEGNGEPREPGKPDSVVLISFISCLVPR